MLCMTRLFISLGISSYDDMRFEKLLYFEKIDNIKKANNSNMGIEKIY